MNKELLTGIGIGAVITIILTFLFYIFIITPILVRRMDLVIKDFERSQKSASKDAVARSRSTIKGQLAEQLYPILSSCPFTPSDMRFLGSPIDYIIFNGYTDAKDDGGEIKDIIFVDIKYGSSRLSTHQRKIKEAVEDGRVRWETIQLNDLFGEK